MKCDCCDVILSDYESSLKSVSTGDFLNTCLKCLQGLEIPYIGNPTLKRKLPEFAEEDDYIQIDEVNEELRELIEEQRKDRLDEW